MVTTFYPPAELEPISLVEGIRRRPGMYFGDVGHAGMHHMLWEVVGNAIDECLYAGRGRVRIVFDGERASVEDSGRGIPIDVQPDGRSALEIAMTTLHTGTGWRPNHVHVRPGLSGVGVGPVCALSSELQVEVWRDGRAYSQRFARGVPLGPIADLGPATRTGTRVTFTPDRSVFEPCAWDIAQVSHRGRELAALMPGIEIIVDEDTYCSPDGVLDHLRYLAGDAPLIEPFHARAHRDGIDVELAIAWADRDEAVLHSFVNVCATHDGTHVEGMFAGLRAVLAPRVKALRRVGPRKLRARLSRGMIAIVHASLADPRFGNPSRDWLENEEVGAAVRGVVETELAAHFERAPALLDWLLLRLER